MERATAVPSTCPIESGRALWRARVFVGIGTDALVLLDATRRWAAPFLRMDTGPSEPAAPPAGSQPPRDLPFASGRSTPHPLYSRVRIGKFKDKALAGVPQFVGIFGGPA